MSLGGQNTDGETSQTGEWLEALPGLARLASGAGWRTAGWALGRSRRLGERMIKAAGSPREAIALADDARLFTIQALRLGATLLELGRPGAAAPPPAAAGEAHPPPHPQKPAQPRAHVSPNGNEPSLRERGRQLLELSRDVNYEDEAHPAYARILDELAPDEGRILLLLLLQGPQPAVDVRTGGPVGLIKSRLIAPGLNMIGAKAGLRYIDRVPAYLNNLFRLGLIWFSQETLADTSRYQLLEAQPDVLEAVKSVAYARVVRRSIHLTPFGEDFCTRCLAPDATRLEELPEHSLPPSSPPLTDELYEEL